MRAIKIIILVVVLSAVVFFTSLFLLVSYLNRNGDRERNHTDSANQEMTFTIEGDIPGALKSLSGIESEPRDEDYYDSVEQTIANADWYGEHEHLKNIDLVIKKIEGEEYVSLFYQSVKGKKTVCFNACKLKIKEFNGVKKYAFLVADYMEEEKGMGRFGGDSTNSVGSMLLGSDLRVSMNVSNQKKRFVWGIHPFENADTLKIEGQQPTEVIPFEELGNTRYFWYFEDLQSDKPASKLEYEMEELEKYKYWDVCCKGW